MAPVTDRTPVTRSLERPLLLTGILASCGLLALLAWPMFSGRVYLHDDLHRLHLPLRWFYAQCLAQGRSFLWIPGLFCGFPLHGDGRVGMTHPFHLALYGGLRLETAFMLELVSSYAAVQLGTYLWLRSRELRRDQALLGSILLAYAPFLTMRFVQPEAMATIAHLPWALWAIDGVVRPSDRRSILRAGLGLAVVTTSQFLMGLSQFTWCTGLLEVLYSLWRVRQAHRSWRLLALAWAKALGVLTAAVQILPTLELLRHASRAGPGDGIAHQSAESLANVLQWIAPYLMRWRVLVRSVPNTADTHELSLYMGAVLPALLVWLMIRRREFRDARPLARWSVLVAAFALTLTFIRATPLAGLYDRVPLLNLVHVNARYYLLFQLATAVLGALAFADLAALRERGQMLPWARLRPLAVLPIVSLAFAGLLWAMVPLRPGLRMALASPVHAVAGPLLAATAAGLVALAARGRRWALPALIVLGAGDVSAYWFSFVSNVPCGDLATVRALMPTPPPPGTGYRVHVREEDQGLATSLILSGMRVTGGHVAHRPLQTLDYDRSPAARRVAGVSAVLVAEKGRFVAWEPEPAPLPRVRLVSHAVLSLHPGEAIDRIDPETTALVDQPVLLPEGPTGTAHLVEDRGDLLRIQTEAETEQFLVVAESYDPGWQVERDGEVVPAIRVYGDFLGCVVPAGSHEVVMRYRSRSFERGLMCTTAGVAVMLGLAIVGWCPRGRGFRSAT